MLRERSCPLSETSPLEPVAVAVEGLSNARRAGDLLFGGQPDAATIARLAEEGFRTVVSTSGRGELDWDQRAAVEAAGMTYVFIPMDKPVETITDDQLRAFDEVMGKAARPMLLHCGSGNRTAGLWAVWLAERQGVSPARALRLGELAGMTQLRPLVEKRLLGR
jgi:uncharacterized protein (TIGR01244 family)